MVTLCTEYFNLTIFCEYQWEYDTNFNPIELKFLDDIFPTKPASTPININRKISFLKIRVTIVEILVKYLV